MSDENPIAIAQKILSEITTGRNKDRKNLKKLFQHSKLEIRLQQTKKYGLLLV